MLKPILALVVIAGLFESVAVAQQSSPVPDPKMPPMPSMETPDQGEMAKPAGAAKQPNAEKKAPSEEPAAKPAKGRSASKRMAPRHTPDVEKKRSAAKAPARRPVKNAARPAGKKRR